MTHRYFRIRQDLPTLPHPRSPSPLLLPPLHIPHLILKTTTPDPYTETTNAHRTYLPRNLCEFPERNRLERYGIRRIRLRGYLLAKKSVFGTKGEIPISLGILQITSCILAISWTTLIGDRKRRRYCEEIIRPFHTASTGFTPFLKGNCQSSSIIDPR